MCLRHFLLVLTVAVFPIAGAGQGVAATHSQQCADGDLRSCAVLGLIYESGAAGVASVERAVELYEMACARDVAAACSRLSLVRDGSGAVAARSDLHRVGYVADAADGAPIGEAVVDVPRFDLRVVADGSGRVDLGELGTGLHEIIVRRDGYETTRGELPVPWETDFLILMTSRADTDPRAPGRVFGRVTVAGSDIGLPDVAVSLSDDESVGAVSDQRGRFSLAGLEPGRAELAFTRLGYEVRRVVVVVQPGRTVEVYAELAEQAVELKPIEVRVGSAYLDRSGFYRRARSARGEHFTRRDVARLDPAVTSDLVWRTPGVTVESGRLGARILSRRPAFGGAGGTCRLRPYLDGIPMFDWDMDLLRPDDLQAMEIYQGTATPVEYRQPSDPDGTPACGVVLIWTRRND